MQDPYAGAPGPADNTGRILSILGIVCGVVAVLFLPIVFGPVGILLGYLGMRKGDPLGRIAIAVAIGGMLLGFLLGAVIFAASDDDDALRMALDLLRR